MSSDVTLTSPGPNTPRGPAPPGGEPVTVGQTLLGRYEVNRELGVGGTGSVYLCRDALAGVVVALKALPAELAHNRSEMGGVLENFQIVEKLHHPAIAAVKHLEMDAKSGRYFLVQEYVEGKGLEKILRESGGKLPWARALGIARQVAGAIDFAHSQRVIHRDIKPANVIVGADDRIKVVDFGIASRVKDAMSTVTGIDRMQAYASGTAAYMPPEQWLGKRQGPATDQYALAMTLHQMVSGGLPFGKGEEQSLRERILNDEPARPVEIPEEAWPAFARAFAKCPEDRHPSCMAFMDELAGPAKPASGRMFSWVRALLAAAAIGLVAGAYLWQRFAREEGMPSAGSAPRNSSTTPAPAIRPSFHALVIGINEYSAGWEPLTNARADAEAVADVLTRKYGFQVKTLLDGQADRAGMLTALDGIADLGPQDSMLVYYAGHGFYDERMDEGFLIPSDGRKSTPEAPAKEGWIWNSTVSKILNASRARHILLVADSCFSGSLFRGGDVEKLGREFQWYKRAYQSPSRYVIASGNMEKVADNGGGGHSAFAHQILLALENPSAMVFSASDLGNSIKARVSELTGQHVRMGSLALTANAGGEFVFLADEAIRNEEMGKPDDANLAGSATNITERAGDPAAAMSSDWANLRDLHELASSGATNSVARLLAASGETSVTAGSVQNRLLRELDIRQERERRDELSRTLQDLNRLMKERLAEKGDGTALPDIARPRVLAFLPLQRSGGGAELDMTASFYTTAMVATFEEQPGFLVIDRANLENVLQEHGLRLSALSDQQAGFEVGKLLPASLLISGQLMQKEGKLLLAVRLIDTASSRYLGTFTSEPHGIEGMGDVLAKLGSALGGKARRARPLCAPLKIEGETLGAGIGSFQRASKDMVFNVLKSPTRGEFMAVTPEPLGSAKILVLGDSFSSLRITWKENRPPTDITGLMLSEMVED